MFDPHCDDTAQKIISNRESPPQAARILRKTTQRNAAQKIISNRESPPQTRQAFESNSKGKALRKCHCACFGEWTHRDVQRYLCRLLLLLMLLSRQQRGSLPPRGFIYKTCHPSHGPPGAHTARESRLATRREIIAPFCPSRHRRHRPSINKQWRLISGRESPSISAIIARPSKRG